MKSFILSLITLTFLAFQPGLQAQENSIRKNAPGKGVCKMNIPNLTEKQQHDIQLIQTEHQRNMIDKKAEMQKIRLDIQELMAAKEIDENKLLSLTEKVSSIQAEMKKDRIKVWTSIYNSLDDNQKEMWKKNSPLLKESCEGSGCHQRAGKMGRHNRCK